MRGSNYGMPAQLQQLARIREHLTCVSREFDQDTPSATNCAAQIAFLVPFEVILIDALSKSAGSRLGSTGAATDS